MFDPTAPSSSSTSSTPECAECNGTGKTQLYFLKVLGHPIRLYESVRVSEFCPYCTPYE